jgi:hypothetical protein
MTFLNLVQCIVLFAIVCAGVAGGLGLALLVLSKLERPVSRA